MINIVICDDESGFVSALKKQIQKYAKEKETQFRIVTFKDGQELIENFQPEFDLIFLDIQMNCMNGMETARKIREMDRKVSIIFLTSLIQYALEGYQYQAVNYILKPIKYVRLKAELDRWLSLYKGKEEKFIFVSNDTGKHKVPLDTIHYIETFQRNVMLHTDDGELVSYRKMKDFEKELEGFAFVRCHSSFLVNLSFIKRVDKLEIQLTSGEQISISQPRRKAVMERMADYWGDML